MLTNHELKKQFLGKDILNIYIGYLGLFFLGKGQLNREESHGNRC